MGLRGDFKRTTLKSSSLTLKAKNANLGIYGAKMNKEPKQAEMTNEEFVNFVHNQFWLG